MSRTVVRIASALIAAVVLADCAPAPDTTRAADEGAAVKQTLIDWYAAYSGSDEPHYRAFVAEDYVLLENGTIMSIEDDSKMMRNRPSGYGRKDAFDFHSVRLYGDLASATYFLESEIVDDAQVQRRKWLESALLRRIDSRWRVALLHSTRMSGTDTPRH